MGGRQPVDQRRVAPGRVVAQAVQQLDPRHGLAVGLIGVRQQGDRGVGEIGRPRVGAHVERPAEVVAGDVPQAITHPAHGAFLGGRVAEDDVAVAVEGVEELDHTLGVLVVGRPSDPRPVDVGERFDRFGPRLGCRRLLGVGPPSQSDLDGHDVEPRRVGVAETAHQRIAVEETRRDGQVGRDVERGEQALPAGGLDLPELLGAVAQPDRVQVG